MKTFSWNLVVLRMQEIWALHAGKCELINFIMQMHVVSYTVEYVFLEEP